MSWIRNWGWSYLVAAGLVLISIFTTWYSIRGSSGNCVITESFNLWQVHISGCSGPSAAGTFSNFQLPLTGQMYLVAFALSILGVLGLLAAGLWTLRRSRKGIRGLPFLVTFAVAVLALSAPALVAFDQPSTVCLDSKNDSPPLNTPIDYAGPARPCTWTFYLGNGVWSGSGQSGPTTSFRGSGTFYGDSLEWGPNVGWYLSLAAAALALAPSIAAVRQELRIYLPKSPARSQSV
jgi:hypothetical protein